MKKSLLLLLATSTLLMGCVDNQHPSSEVPSSDETSSKEEISSSEETSSPSSEVDDDVDHTPLEDLSDISTQISVSGSGYLNDISVGMSLAGHSSYPITFELTDNATGVTVVRSDNENVLTVESNSSGTAWTLKTHKQGYAHLIIEDGDTIIHFRQLITVKRKMTEEEVAESLLDVDHFVTVKAFESFTGHMTMTFMNDDIESPTGYINGTESGGVTLSNESFKYAYDGKYNNIAEDHEHWYIYKVSNWGIDDFIFTYFAVWNTGDRVHAHTGNGLLGIFEPAEEA